MKKGNGREIALFSVKNLRALGTMTGLAKEGQLKHKLATRVKASESKNKLTLKARRGKISQVRTLHHLNQFKARRKKIKQAKTLHHLNQ